MAPPLPCLWHPHAVAMLMAPPLLLPCLWHPHCHAYGTPIAVAMPMAPPLPCLWHPHAVAMPMAPPCCCHTYGTPMLLPCLWHPNCHAYGTPIAMPMAPPCCCRAYGTPMLLPCLWHPHCHAYGTPMLLPCLWHPQLPARCRTRGCCSSGGSLQASCTAACGAHSPPEIGAAAAWRCAARCGEGAGSASVLGGVPS